jgi:hypothetical protein
MVAKIRKGINNIVSNVTGLIVWNQNIYIRDPEIPCDR